MGPGDPAACDELSCESVREFIRTKDIQNAQTRSEPTQTIPGPPFD